MTKALRPRFVASALSIACTMQANEVRRVDVYRLAFAIWIIQPIGNSTKRKSAEAAVLPPRRRIATFQVLRTMAVAATPIAATLVIAVVVIAVVALSEGRKRAKAEGVTFGRPREIDAKAAALVKGLKAKEGLSVPEISIRTGLSVASVYRALSI